MSSPLLQEMHEVQTLRHELADTRKKLQEYADTIVSLHGELRTLRERICNMCKRKFVLVNLVSPHAEAESAPNSPSLMNHIPRGLCQRQAEPTNSAYYPRLLKMHALEHIPTKSGPPTSEMHRSIITTPSPLPQTFPFTLPQSPLPVSSSTSHTLSPVLTTSHRHEKPVSVSSPPTIASSSRTITVKTVPSVPRWSVKRDTNADAVLDVALVCAFNHKDPVRSVRFSADGKYLASALSNSKWHNDGSVIIYDVETCKKTCALVENASRYSSKARPGIRCVCFSPDGRCLVVGDTEGRVTVWDIPKNRIRNVFRGSKNYVESVDVSSDGRLVVSASWDGTVRTWNLRDGSEKLFSDIDPAFWSVRFSPNGKYIAAGNSDGVLRMWDVRTGRLVKRWTGHKRYVQSVAFTPDGRRLVSGGRDGVVKCWDLSSLGESGGGPPEILEYRGHTVTIYSIAISPDAQWVVYSSSDNTAILRDTRSAMRRYTLIAEGSAASSTDFSPVGTYLATGCSNGSVTLWRYSGACVQ